MPGNEWPSAPMTRRIFGTTESNRNTRNILKAGSTDKAPLVGAQEIATIMKSNQFQPERKKSLR
mgnify:CR=1 FL=1